MENRENRTRRNNISKSLRAQAFDAWRRTYVKKSFKNSKVYKTKRQIVEEELNLIFAPLSSKRALFTESEKNKPKGINKNDSN